MPTYFAVTFEFPILSQVQPFIFKKDMKNGEPHTQYIMCAIPGIEYEYFQNLVRQWDLLRVIDT